MTSEIQERHKKQLAVMRGFLEGGKFYLSAEALELVRGTENGTRKDGVTPKLHHQLSVARLISTLLPHLLYPEETLAAAFLHDLLEDHGPQWTQEKLSDRFGPRVAGAVWTLSKKTHGLVKTPEAYYEALAECPIASLVKLSDRAHNIQTMHGVFSPEKQKLYVGELDTHYFPMIRIARRRYPQQYGAYENLKILLRCQQAMVHRILEASGVRVAEEQLTLGALGT